MGKYNGFRFAVGAAIGGQLVGVAVVGNPVGIGLQDGWTLEVNRSCTDGTRNANSILYGAAWRGTRALGFHRLITYTLPEESGSSLRACGWQCIGEAGGGTWNRPNIGRLRVDKHPISAKLRWEIETPDYQAVKQAPPPTFEDEKDDAQLSFDLTDI